MEKQAITGTELKVGMTAEILDDQSVGPVGAIGARLEGMTPLVPIRDQFDVVGQIAVGIARGVGADSAEITNDTYQETVVTKIYGSLSTGAGLSFSVSETNAGQKPNLRFSLIPHLRVSNPATTIVTTTRDAQEDSEEIKRKTENHVELAAGTELHMGIQFERIVVEQVMGFDVPFAQLGVGEDDAKNGDYSLTSAIQFGYRF